ncbi:MAG: septal ring lytic transglycosylase RlpA family lipoprotein [Desulfobulbus propionicus]|nr:MAG: septal ring lytic transglycosylase RlpA family lipoprotein [Desulfobulbus propionicus]
MTQRTTVLLALILLVSVLPTCSTYTSTPAPQSFPGPQPNTTSSEPTQRPYIINGIKYYPIPTAEGFRQQGYASWYGKKFHGRTTANGETYDMYGATAAHKTLPMGTMLLVKNLRNKKTCVVRVNDRGPFVKNRIIDLTYTAAEKIGMIHNGTDPVEIVALSKKKYASSTPSPPSAKRALSPTNQFEQGNFYVQTGAFVQLDRARKLAHVFAAKGRDVTIQQYPAAGMDLYRVLVHAGNTLAKARAYERYLELNGFPYALVLAR